MGAWVGQTFAGIVKSLIKGAELIIRGNSSIIGDNTGDQTDATLPFSDITTNNSSKVKHGFLKKLSNSAITYMDGTGLWSIPAGTGISSITVTAPITSTGGLTPTIGFTETTQASIVAHAGGGQLNAVLIVAHINSVDTVANPLDSVKLLTGLEGNRFYIFNNGTNILDVYPSSGGFIKGKAVDMPYPLYPQNGRWFTCYVAVPSEIGTYRVF